MTQGGERNIKMAEPKYRFLVEGKHLNFIVVWTDNPSSDFAKIKKIEGTHIVTMFEGSSNPIHVHVDPRYDQKEVAQEIRDLLTAGVPDVFKEE